MAQRKGKYGGRKSGPGDDSGWGVAIDNNGYPVMSGITNSKDFPASAKAYQGMNHGGDDAFVAKFQGAGFHDFCATCFGSDLPSSHQLAENSFSSIAFIGLPCPTNKKGIGLSLWVILRGAFESPEFITTPTKTSIDIGSSIFLLPSMMLLPCAVPRPYQSCGVLEA
jgi:hypothetical protein